MSKRALRVATVEEILHELTQIAMGKREFEAIEKTTKEIVGVLPSEGAVMKALELLGKSQQLFSEKQETAENLRVNVSVIETDNRA